LGLELGRSTVTLFSSAVVTVLRKRDKREDMGKRNTKWRKIRSKQRARIKY
jgi:hypothetical protein